MMVRHGSAWAAKINGNAYRDFLRNNPDLEKITLTRPQMEAIIRDLIDYTDRDAEATAWAEQATKNAAEIGVLRARLTDALATVRDYEGALCDIHHGIDHPRGRSIETADFYMAVGWFVGKAEQVLDKHDLIAHEPSDEEAGENDL